MRVILLLFTGEQLLGTVTDGYFTNINDQITGFELTFILQNMTLILSLCNFGFTSKNQNFECSMQVNRNHSCIHHFFLSYENAMKENYT